MRVTEGSHWISRCDVKQYDPLEKKLAAALVIVVPTITMEGDVNGAPHPELAA
jgi:hypothetical protein